MSSGSPTSALALPFHELWPRQAPNGTTNNGNGTAPPPPPPQQTDNQNATGGTPLSVFTFIIAVALFATVISFVLFRTWRSRRNGGHLLHDPTQPGMARLFGLTGRIEDNSVPPKLWQTRFVPYSDQTPPASSSMAGSGQSGWSSLMPVAASLPASVYLDTGVDPHLQPAGKDRPAGSQGETTAAPSTGRRNRNNNAAPSSGNGQANASGTGAEGNDEKKDPEEPLPGSVNISVLIAMPSPPKSKDALPELMLGTAAVPILSSRAPQTSIEGRSGAGDSGYFPEATANPPSTNPTRAQLISLIMAARQAKERQKDMADKKQQQHRQARSEQQQQQPGEGPRSPSQSDQREGESQDLSGTTTSTTTADGVLTPHATSANAQR